MKTIKSVQGWAIEFQTGIAHRVTHTLVDYGYTIGKRWTVGAADVSCGFQPASHNLSGRKVTDATPRCSCCSCCSCCKADQG